MAAAPALMIAGTAIGAIGSIAAGQNAANAARYNAQVNQQNARIALSQGEADVVRQGQINYRRLSGIKAAVGASGVRLEGSPLDVLESSASNAELDVQNIRYNAQLKAAGFNSTADLNLRRARNAQVEGLFNAASGSLMGGYRVSSMQGTGTPLRTFAETGDD